MCGNIANKLSSTNVKIDRPDKSKKSKPKKTVPSSKSNNRDNKENNFAFIGGILRDMHLTLEQLDRSLSGRLDHNLSETNEHLWWVALGVKLGLIMMSISIFIMLVSLG